MGVEVPSNPINRKEQYLAKIAGYAVDIPAEPITREEAYLDQIAKNGSGGGGGTSDYSQLTNKPQINGVTLSGDKSASDLSLASLNDIAAIKDGQNIDSFADVEDALSNKQNATDNSLETTAKTIVGAINEHEDDISSLNDRFDDIVGYSERVNRLNYKELTWTNGARDDSGEPTSSGGSHYSSMIEVLPNTTYTISGTISTATVWRIYYLTSNGTWISRSSTLPRPYTFTTPSNCGNIQIQCSNVESLSGAQLQYGDVARPFETYKDQLGVLLDRVPIAPTTDGTYNLQVTVSSGTPTYSWVSTT